MQAKYPNGAKSGCKEKFNSWCYQTRGSPVATNGMTIYAHRYGDSVVFSIVTFLLFIGPKENRTKSDVTTFLQ